jgi:hypothetical protein
MQKRFIANVRRMWRFVRSFATNADHVAALPKEIKYIVTLTKFPETKAWDSKKFFKITTPKSHNIYLCQENLCYLWKAIIFKKNYNENVIKITTNIKVKIMI